VTFPHGTGLMMSGVRGGLVAGHEDGDDTSRRRELRLLKNKFVSCILNTGLRRSNCTTNFILFENFILLRKLFSKIQNFGSKIIHFGRIWE